MTKKDMSTIAEIAEALEAGFSAAEECDRDKGTAITDASVLAGLPHGARVAAADDVLVMNREYPRIAFDCIGPDGRHLGHLYPHHVFGHYDTDRVYPLEPQE